MQALPNAGTFMSSTRKRIRWLTFDPQPLRVTSRVRKTASLARLETVEDPRFRQEWFR